MWTKSEGLTRMHLFHNYACSIIVFIKSDFINEIIIFQKMKKREKTGY